MTGKETYCLDTSAIIGAWNNWYRFENHPGFWQLLDDMATEDRILVPQAVMAELSENGSKTQDPLYQWFKKREHYMCAHESREIQVLQARLCEVHKGFGGSGIPGNKDYADPWVVATAIECNAIVITDERERRNRQEKFRIPEVCDKEGVPVSRIYRIVNQSGRAFQIGA